MQNNLVYSEYIPVEQNQDKKHEFYPIETTKRGFWPENDMAAILKIYSVQVAFLIILPNFYCFNHEIEKTRFDNFDNDIEVNDTIKGSNGRNGSINL